MRILWLLKCVWNFWPRQTFDPCRVALFITVHNKSSEQHMCHTVYERSIETLEPLINSTLTFDTVPPNVQTLPKLKNNSQLLPT